MKRTAFVIISACLFSGCGPEKEEESYQSIKMRADLKVANARITELDQQLSRARDIESKADALIATLQVENRNLSSEVASLNGQLALSNSKMESMRQLGRAEAQLEALTTPSRTASTYIPPAAAIAPQADPEPPAWRYPSAHEAKKIISKAAEEKWGENFRMVEHEIEQQTTAYQGLYGYEKKRWSIPVIRRALNAAGNKWGTNFNMVLYEIEQQLEAKDRLDAKR